MKNGQKFYSSLKEYLNKNNDFKFEPKGKNSFRFKFNMSDYLSHQLSSIFNIKIEKEYFDEVCNGTGSEIDKIDSIWSSSLLSFLVFYLAIKNGGITMELNNNKVHFDEVYFEFLNPTFCKNPKVNSDKVSNIDCVLLSDDKKNILFIESKFKEYVTDVVTNSKSCSFSEKYSIDDFTKELYEIYSDIANECSKDKEHYLYGIKQLITHYSGLRNFERGTYHNNYLNNPSDRRNEIIKAKGKKETNFYFMEIIYDLSELGYKNQFDDYKEISSKIEEKMASIKIDESNKAINIIPLTTYQDFIKNNNIKLPDKVMNFYFNKSN